MNHPVSTTEDPRWQAVIDRDPAQASAFVYGVTSTGVFCRSTCPSRRPKPENVRFFATPAAATAAGFRACKRCTPEAAALRDTQAAIIAHLCREIETAETEPALADLARQAGLSPFHLHRVFKAATGVTPKAYARAHRAKKMRDTLKTSATVTEAIYDAGFNASSRFYADTKTALGMTPTAFRKGGVNEDIRFAVGQSRLGALLVAQSEKGVCAVFLGDDPEGLVRDLQDSFPNARLIGADTDFEETLARVAGLIEAPGTGLDLPLDIRGTVFQQKVWAALQAIPAGQRLSYSELAERIGAPKAVRAVASACASNTIAVAIPCHRIVRNDGALSGYRWGVERKAALLEREN
ncbi:bifunctional DNA-binding transcriptional regulator/O6-methylguanine-DNA methyltransferase Ada [Asticcacaulis sp. BYS171W]|uniref:Bifunctional DNA-binding transcriptional regulator/O6-methylguanine-DNA methyltransferase Ada n=1 Tax=Asticcacaulis aquaticus TaxID=2984212 RepID=A0ABT5I004_9CAUL|nr:bifunctional DNA-binding transcriptional regulator/O6-methylguanine-DNA methyltransferase Ada [Asticcacaulis aquaticus]MDC7685011.1 bifunctional DNA-binding transcriptional regulator/O6-methylguanine-DNA methyltransferase Ada [Asticcacaulis aquaticus]